MFLPDRFIKGECPKCHAKDQYGDSAKFCGTTIRRPICSIRTPAVSGATPERRTSTLLFGSPTALRTISYATGLQGLAQPEATNKMREWLGEGDEHKLWTGIFRATPYFGFEIPKRAGQIFLRLARCAGRLLRQFFKTCAQKKGLDFDRWIPSPIRPPSNTISLAKTHPAFPHAVLAGNPEISGHRTPITYSPTAFDRGRREK